MKGLIVFVLLSLFGLSLTSDDDLSQHRQYFRSLIQKVAEDKTRSSHTTQIADDSDEEVITDAPPTHPSHVVGQFIHPRGHFLVYWVYKQDLAHFYISSPFRSWMGIGFSKDQYMSSSDIIVCSLNRVDNDDEDVYSDSFLPVISDRYTPVGVRSMPHLDEQQDAELLSGYYVNEWSVIEFQRQVDTHDIEHDLRLNEVSYLLWAVGSTNSQIDDDGYGDFTIHQLRGIIRVHFPTGKATHIEDISREEAHASLMLYAWGFFAVISIFCVRYMKEPLGSWWFVIHATLSVLIFLLTISGFSVIISYVSHQGHHHFNSVHKILGLLVTVSMIMQLWLGLFTHFKYDSDRDRTPTFPDKVHWWVGRITAGAAFLNILSGFLLFSETGETPWILLLTWTVAIVVFVVLFEIYYRDVSSRTTATKEYQLLELGAPIARQNNSALLFCFASLVFVGILLITLAVSLLER
jgi:hypothetical protein